jgi:uncharacterized protein with GYD domain
MPRYVSFFSYTGEAWARMLARPSNRAEAARETIEAMGGRMEAFYWMFGEYDGFVVYEVPHPAMAAAFAAGVTSSGLLRIVITNELIDMEDAHAALRMASGVAASYLPPGGWRAEYDALG